MKDRFVTFEEYDFDQTVPPELEALFDQYGHIFGSADPFTDVEAAWTMEKPASWVELLYPAEKTKETTGIPDGYGLTEEDYPGPEEVGVFLYEFSRWFHFEFDGFRLFFSRFPTLPPFLAHAGQKRGDSALAGILLGYTPADVAQWHLNQGGRFKLEPGFEH